VENRHGRLELEGRGSAPNFAPSWMPPISTCINFRARMCNTSLGTFQGIANEDKRSDGEGSTRQMILQAYEGLAND
jgi:hypothetical protein